MVTVAGCAATGATAGAGGAGGARRAGSCMMTVRVDGVSITGAGAENSIVIGGTSGGTMGSTGAGD